MVEIIVLVLNHQASDKKRIGQHLLRLNILSKAFNFTPSLELSYLKSEIDPKEEMRVDHYSVNDYYSSTDCDELMKLKGMLAESCFWTQALYKESTKLALRFLIVYLLLFVVIVAFFIGFDFFSEKSSLVRFFILLLTCVPLREKLMSYLRFKHAQEELTKLDYKLKNVDVSLSSLLVVLTDYCVITSYTPLIRDNVYDENKERLNKIWRDREL